MTCSPLLDQRSDLFTGDNALQRAGRVDIEYDDGRGRIVPANEVAELTGAV